MAVRLSALRTGRPLPPGRFLVFISVSGSDNPRATVRLEGLRKSKKSPSPGLAPATFRFVAQCLNQLRYHVRHIVCVTARNKLNSSGRQVYHVVRMRKVKRFAEIIVHTVPPRHVITPNNK
jgi:hypothetical protein